MTKQDIKTIAIWLGQRARRIAESEPSDFTDGEREAAKMFADWLENWEETNEAKITSESVSGVYVLDYGSGKEMKP